MQIDEGGAVKACKLIVSRVVSGSNEVIRTVWSSHPTAYTNFKFKKKNAKLRITYEIWRPLPSLGYLSNT